MSKRYFSYAYTLFGDLFAKKRLKYHRLRHNLLKSRMNIGYDMYLSGAMLSAIIGSILVFLFFNVLIFITGIPEIPGTRLYLPYWFAPIVPYKALIVQVSGSIAILLLSFVSIFKGFILYPALIAGDRKRNIEQILPYAINYMSAMSGAGVLPVELFKSLAKNSIYGEVAVEVRYLVRDMEVLGKDLVTAMKNISLTTPSPMLQEFLQGAITVVTSGGELEPYFKIKTDQYIVENRQRQKEFLETLGLLGETYVTAFVAGPLFLIIVISIMSIMGGANMLFLYILVYAIVPVGSILFVILISSLTPEE
ncbi:type II secretion system F family protein [Methanohalophilus portucalensis]|uniref:Flagellar protein FlaJ n=2 Tax=Methanohalophilus portucalensis TaxID=39664 RepID=A0A1L9C4A0_9EURY|nr:type II secretion system F family protein [Methanohalophilus portucalensis]ATU07900.1 secretion system protein [Methanohalophilus portucalensis]OJH49266.1 type II secretion system protein [Methanohalophilus portucalensis FDF-1]RNI11616.1 secretion system protein [Methanohalophilus portucalensis FDF-1]SMH42068.1 flagellar protein FlaJ [Methanohalophilus portucalensis FDF-1]